jgi:tetratricopeptide (TPR) repeat protein
MGESRRDEAIRLMDEALGLRPDFADALCMGGYMLSECGSPESAMRFYHRALEIDASLVIGHVNIGKLLFAAGRSRKRSLASKRRRSSRRATRTRGVAARERSVSWGDLRNPSRRPAVRFNCAATFPKPRSILATRF